MSVKTDSIEDVMTSYVRAWRSNDMDAWGSLFTDDCDFIGWAGDWWRSRTENVAGHRAVPEIVVRQRPRYSLEIAAVDPLAPDIALVHAHWQWPDFVAGPDAIAEHRRGVLTMVMVRRDGGWRIRASHNGRLA